MAPQVGTYNIEHLLDVRFQSVNEFGVDTVVQVLQNDVDAHNAIVTEMVQQIAEPTTDTQRVYGTGSVGEMIEVDEYGRSETQVTNPGSSVGFPLRLFQYGTGWTRKYMQTATPRDLALKVQAAQKAHLQRIRRDIKRAIYLSSNYSWKDFLIDNVTYGVKRFVNADSATIPDGPDGATFNAATHTHYDAINGLTATAMDNAILDLIEHGHGERVMMGVAAADAATVSAISGFVKAQPVYLEQIANTTNVPAQRSDLGNQFNRLLGYYGAAEVWVKPWAVANYLFTWDAGSPMKPLVMRQRNVAAPLQGLQIAAELDAYPLYAQYMEAEFGFAVWTRTNGHVLYFGGGSYTDPTIS